VTGRKVVPDLVIDELSDLDQHLELAEAASAPA
jgi:hypothetical protein